MKKIVRMIKIMALIIILLGIVTSVVDYFQLKNNDFPLFAVRSYEVVGKKETFRGLFYKATRKVTISNNETIALSKDLKFEFLVFNINITRNPLVATKDFKIETTEEKNCSTSKLYFYNDTNKIYTYCLDNIKINNKDLKSNLESDFNIIDKVINHLFISKKTNLYTQYIDLEETNLTNKGLSIIQCESDNTDIYIGPRAMSFEEDFCTNKDDVEKKEEQEENKVVEVPAE